MKTRQEAIETDYVNGVFNEKGEQVIRSLDEVEKEWLSQFYREVEHENFVKTEEIKAHEDQLKDLQKSLRAKRREMSGAEILKAEDEIDRVYDKLVYLRAEANSFYPEEEDRKEIRKRHYDSRNDMFGVAKATNRLISFDLPEFDQFTTRAEKDISPEDLALDYLTKKPVRKVIRRKKK